MSDWPIEEVLDHLRRGQPVCDARIADKIDLRALCEPGGDGVRVPVTFIECDCRELSAMAVEFDAPVHLERTVVRFAASFYAAYFFRGLRVDRCRFESAVDFQCGGHNKDGAEITILDTAFAGFVNFFDCQYEGPLIIRRCSFASGTNLLGNVGQPFEVGFDVPPVIEDTSGSLDLPGG